MERVVTVEKKGKNVDEALKAALEELKCERDQVEIEVVDEGSKGFMGLGAKPCVIRVSMSISPEIGVRKVLEDLLNHMQLDYEIERVEVNEGTVRINIVGQDMGLLIGRKGETLNAVQFLVGLIVNNKSEDRVRVVLDVEDYRKKREESLEALAVRLSDKVKKTRKNVVLRPMNSTERRIVHTTLQNDPEIATYSVGAEPSRKVIISLKR